MTRIKTTKFQVNRKKHSRYIKSTKNKRHIHPDKQDERKNNHKSIKTTLTSALNLHV